MLHGPLCGNLEGRKKQIANETIRFSDVQIRLPKRRRPDAFYETINLKATVKKQTVFKFTAYPHFSIQ